MRNGLLVLKKSELWFTEKGFHLVPGSECIISSWCVRGRCLYYPLSLIELWLCSTLWRHWAALKGKPNSGFFFFFFSLKESLSSVCTRGTSLHLPSWQRLLCRHCNDHVDSKSQVCSFCTLFSKLSVAHSVRCEDKTLNLSLIWYRIN